MTDSTTISKRIQLILERTNNNYRSFGKLLGFSDVVVGNIIKGRNNPSFDFLSKLLQTFDWVNANWLITGKGEMIIGGERANSYQLTENVEIVSEMQPKYNNNQNNLLQQKDKEIERLMGIIEMMIKENNAGQISREERKTG